MSIRRSIALRPSRICDNLDERLSELPYLGGETRGLADIAIFPFVRQFANADRDRFDALDLPHLQDWLRRLIASDLFTAVMRKHGKWVPD